MGRNLRRVYPGLLCALVLGSIFFRPSGSADAAEPIRVYVFAGQSNMVGADAVASELPLIAPGAVAPAPAVLFWGPVADFPNGWAPLQAPTEIVQPRLHQGFGPEIGAGQHLARRHEGGTVAIVKFASSGTDLHSDWNPHRPDGLYRIMIGRVRDAVARLRATRHEPVRISGFFWMQGEADSRRRDLAEAYEANLARFVSAVRKDLKTPKLPFVFGRITDLGRENPDFKYSGVVRRGQSNVARNVPDAYMVSTDDLERSADRIHFNSRGTFELGERFANPSFPL
jgi:hypothetical protein